MLKNIILVSIAAIFLIACSKREPDTADHKFRTTPDNIRHQYQEAYGSMFAIKGSALNLNPPFRGPHEGPGIVTAIDGPLLQIQWFDLKDGVTEVSTTRFIHLSKIRSLDSSPIEKESYLIFYDGPFGNSEYAVIRSNESFAKNLIARWKSYLLSQEGI